MEGALAWLSEFIRFLADFFPHRAIVKTTHGAVKFVGGRRAVQLGPGLHWYWPFYTEFWEYPIARQALDLPTQTIVTSDERAIAAGGIIVYRVFDILALVARTYSPDQTVKDIALTAFHQVLCRHTWRELLEGAARRQPR
jgi:regulator of protease activity HflC (stomatin/prohibitin superfamily)